MIVNLSLFVFHRFHYDGVRNDYLFRWNQIRYLLSIALETEDILEMLQRASPDETAAVFLCIALQPVVTVVVKEQLHILVRCIIQTVFEGYIVEERLVAIGILCACRHLSTHQKHR